MSEHIYRFAQALDVWQHPFWARYARRRPRRLLRVRARADRPAAGHRGGLRRPAREDRMANLLEARDLDYVVGSVHFIRDGAVDMDDYERLGRRAQRRARSGGATSRRSARPRAAGCSTSSPTPISSRSGAPSGRAPEGDLRRYYELAMDGDRRVRRRRRGVDRRAAQAASASSTRRARSCEMCLEAGRPVALSSDAHRPERRRRRLRPARWSCSTRSASASLPCSSAASGAWSRSARRAGT